VVAIRNSVFRGVALCGSSILKMEATRFSESSVLTKPTRRHIPEDGMLQELLC
jgi:hypothetical protein